MNAVLDEFLGAATPSGVAVAIPFPQATHTQQCEFECDEMPDSASLYAALRSIRLLGCPVEDEITAAELVIVSRRNRTRFHRIPLAEVRRDKEDWLLSGVEVSALASGEFSDTPTSWLLYLVTCQLAAGPVVHRLRAAKGGRSFTLPFHTASGAPRHFWGNCRLVLIGHPRWHAAKELAGTASGVAIAKDTFSARFRFPRPPAGTTYLGLAFVSHPAGTDRSVIRRVEAEPHDGGRSVTFDVAMPLAALAPEEADGVRLFWQPYALLELPSGEVLFVPAPTTPIQLLPFGRYLRLLAPRPYGHVTEELIARFHRRPHSWGLFTMAKPPSQRQTLLLDVLAAGIYCLLAPVLRFRHVWLFYEKFFSARENAMVFFRYCVQHQVDKTHRICLRYVCSKNSPEYAANLADVDDGRVVEPGTLRHRVLLLASRLLLSTETKLLASGIDRANSTFNRWIRKSKPLWFLEHGIKAFKFPDSYTRATLTYVTTCNASEQEWMRRLGGWPPDDIVLTGLARWDNLVDRAPERVRPLVIVMPTFRLWLNDVPDDIFTGSEFFGRWREFLESPRLHRWLRERDVDLVFHTHPLMDSRLAAFVHNLPPSIRILSGDDPPLFSLIQEASLFVTDFSSIVFHGLYLGKPAIFYPFDRERFAAASHPLVNLETNLPGPGPVTLEGVLDEMEAAAARHWTLRPDDIPRRDHYFAFRDHNNCQRTLDAILARKL